MTGPHAVLSPDGRHLVYQGPSDRGSQVYVRALDQFDARALPGTEGANNALLAFSPDGQRLAFASGGRLKKVTLTSGAPPITFSHCPASCCAGGSMTWQSDDGIILPPISTGLVRISGQGGTPVAVSTADTEHREIDHHSPASLPGSKALLLSVHRGADAFDVAVHRLDTGERRVLVQDAFEPRYLPTGHLVFARGNTLFAAPFDAERLELTGAAVAVIENVQTRLYSGAAGYRISDEGTLAYTPATPLQGRKLVWVDRSGRADPLPIGPRGFGAPSLSPDGRRLAVHIDEGSRSDIWIYEISTDSLTRATFDGTSLAPMWTPDGQRLVFSSTKDGRREIYWSRPMARDSLSGSSRTTTASGRELVAQSTDARLHATTADRPQRRRPSSARRASDDGACRVQRCTRAVAPDLSRWQVAGVCSRGNGSTGYSGSLCDWTCGCGWEATSLHRGRRSAGLEPRRPGALLREGLSVHGRIGWLAPGSHREATTDCRCSVRATLSGRGDIFGPAGYDVSLDGQRLLIVQEAARSRLPARFTLC